MIAKKYFILFLIFLLSLILRLYRINDLSLYSDEANQAYNAYSILNTGKDEHSVWLPVTLRSFGDWKPPLQTYLMIPFIKMSGLTEMSVRLPNAILGSISVILVFMIVLKFFDAKSARIKIALISALLISISPWHMHQSRSAMLVMTWAFFLLSGLYFYFSSIRYRYWLILSAVSFSLAIYGYYGARLIIPLLLLFLLIFFRKNIIGINKYLIGSFIVGIIFMLPLLAGFIKNNNVIFGRVKSISIFYDRGVVLRERELHTQDSLTGIAGNISLFFHNKYYLYGLDILSRFLSHFEGDFLFFRGDFSPPFRIPNMGVLYLWDAILIPLGVIYLFKSKNKYRWLLVFLSFISVLPAALTFITPSHNRSFTLFITLVIFSSLGLIKINNICTGRFSRLPILPIILLACFLFRNYLVNYFYVLPKSYSGDWLYGFKEVAGFLKENNNRFTKIYFLPNTGMSYIYILFYNKFDPHNYQLTAMHGYSPDKYGFEWVNSFDKYRFFRQDRSWDNLAHLLTDGEVYIGRENEIPKEFSRKDINYPDGQVAFRITYK